MQNDGEQGVKVRKNDMLTLPQHTLFCFDVVFKVSRGEPNFYALTYVLNRVGEDDLGIIGGLVWR